MKQRLPWRNIEKQYFVGARILGEVVKLQPFWTSIKLGRCIQGFLSVSEFRSP